MEKNIRILVGHFGSGKSEIAIDDAILASHRGLDSVLVDLDIVKPYFRCRLLRDTLRRENVRLVAPQGEQFYADLPIVVPEIRGVIQDGRSHVIMDVGGDDTGARVLGSFDGLLRPERTELVMVLNVSRPFTDTIESILAMADAIEQASKLRLTSLISNTHLMDETTATVVENGYRRAREAARRLALPVESVVADRRIALRLDPAKFDCPIRIIDRLILPPFAKAVPGRMPLRGVI